MVKIDDNFTQTNFVENVKLKIITQNRKLFVGLKSTLFNYFFLIIPSKFFQKL